MSKNRKECYDATDDVVEYALMKADEWYTSHPLKNIPDEEDEFQFYMHRFAEKFYRGWKERMYRRYPYNYNAKMAENTDLSPATLRRICNH